LTPPIPEIASSKFKSSGPTVTDHHHLSQSTLNTIKYNNNEYGNELATT
jgi:hypothetical protein